MSQPFTVTCFRYDVGIFTVFGAKIKQSKVTYPNDIKAVNNIPSCQAPRFIDKLYYDVILYTNPELTQSFSCYRDNNRNKAEIYLDNFIQLCKNNIRYIDLSKVPNTPFTHDDICNFEHHCHHEEHVHDCHKPVFYKNDCFEHHIPDWEIDPRYINDPRRNPYYDVFYNNCYETKYFGEPPHHHHPYEMDDCCHEPIDCHKQPGCDGEIIKFIEKDKHCHFPHNPLGDIHYIDDCDIHHFPYEHHHDYYCHHPEDIPSCPPPPHPHPHDSFVIYYGNGGFAMGESVMSNIKEISHNALRTMLKKNYNSTFSNMNPPDKIMVKKEVLNCINPYMTFKTNMTTPGEWSFFMIPDIYFKLVENFNWYYKEDALDGIWKELDNTIPQRTFTIQDNGVRYFINAVKLNGRYDMRFAKANTDFNQSIDNPMNPDNIIVTNEPKFMISINIQDFMKNKYSATIEDLSSNNQIVRTLSGFIEDEIAWQSIENHIYELKVYSTDKTSPIIVKYFTTMLDTAYKYGFCTWISDSYDSTKTLVENGFERVNELEPPKTSSYVNKIILTANDIE